MRRNPHHGVKTSSVPFYLSPASVGGDLLGCKTWKINEVVVNLMKNGLKHNKSEKSKNLG
jgi:hypothetical protein